MPQKQLVRKGEAKKSSEKVSAKSGTDSVLDLQAKYRMLDPSVAAGFAERAAAMKGKDKTGFFRTPTYKKMKGALTTYIAKQGSKTLGWRKGKVATLDGLIDSWLSKKKNAGDKTSDGRARWAAVKWLEPKIKAEVRYLDNPTPIQGRARSNAVSRPNPKSAGKTGPVGGEMLTSEATTMGVEGAGKSSSALTAPLESGAMLIDDTPIVEQVIEQMPDGRDDAKEDVVDEDKDKEEESSAESKTISGSSQTASGSGEEAKQESEPSKTVSESQSSQTRSSETPADSWEALSAGEKAKKRLEMAILHETGDAPEGFQYQKWGAVVQRDTEYQEEFVKGSHHLVDVYNSVANTGKQITEDGNIRFLPLKKGEPLTRDEQAYYLEHHSGWAWPRKTFEKYWDKLVAIAKKGAFPEKYVPPKEDLFEDTISSVKSKSSQPSVNDTQSSKQTASETESQPDDASAEAVKVKELGPEQRGKYRLAFDGGNVTRGGEKEPFDTTNMRTNKSGAGWGIFVMSRTGLIYAGSHKVALFHHSSFLAGADVAAAGEIQARDGKITAVSNKSGHYKPKDVQNVQMIRQLHDMGVSASSYKFLKFPEDPYGKADWFSSASDYLERVDLATKSRATAKATR